MNNKKIISLFLSLNLLVPVILWLKPDEATIEKLQILKNQGCEIIIITARPIQLEGLTKKWFMSRYVPFDKLFCVGFGKGTKERKLKIIKDENIVIFIDGNKSCRDFLKKNSVNAIASIKQLN